MLKIYAYYEWTRRKRLHLLLSSDDKISGEYQRLTDAIAAACQGETTEILLFDQKTCHRLTVTPAPNPLQPER